MNLSYHQCPGGLLLPILNEGGWNRHVRGGLYLAGLLYCFLGVAIIADVFMCAIEKITSKTKKITLSAQRKSEGGDDKGDVEPGSDVGLVAEGQEEVIEVKVWNETVANLTLMALGSSAPEILLSIIEILFNDFKSGELGPGTIVGSAAFNLCMITAVCIIAVPHGETRSIQMIRVFGVTTFFSIFAYVWLLIVLVLVSPDIVEWWEGLLTFLFFPLLVLLAYLTDRGILLPDKSRVGSEQKQIELKSSDDPERAEGGDAVALHEKTFFKNGSVDRPGLLSFIKEVRKHRGLSDADVATLAAARLADEQAHSRAWYRVSAIRDFTGGRRTKPSISAQLQHKLDQEVRELFAVAHTLETPSESVDASPLKKKDTEGTRTKLLLRPLPDIIHMNVSYVEFNASKVAVFEKSKTAEVILRRAGNIDAEIEVQVETIDGTAVAHEDYKPIKRMVHFAAGDRTQTISIEIVDDQQWEPDESFFLRLTVPISQKKVKLGRRSVMEIIIMDDDEPGRFQFLRRGVLVKENVGTASLLVVRERGCDGVAHVQWRTIGKTAVEGKDYVGGEGKLVFENGEKEKAIEIEIIDDFEAEKDEHFEVELLEPSAGSTLGAHTKCTVTIANDDDFNSMMNRILMMTNVNVDKIRLHNESWGEQFQQQMNVNGGDIENATTSDYVFHGLNFFWKLLFSFVPPPGYGGGWPCFIVALICIGVLTAIIGDLATIFGCLVGLENTVTAISFVALGTSLPDLFASRTAARTEKFADNAIGNVTGSNSVNVFLGLGLPWLMASVYWHVKGGQFEVKAGTLGFSVAIYCAIAFVAVALILARRYLHVFGKAELGGNKKLAWASSAFLTVLWLVYLVLSSLKAYEKK